MNTRFKLYLSRPNDINMDSLPGVLISRSMAPDWTNEDFRKYNVELDSYHWDDRTKLFRDSRIIRDVVRELIDQLAVQLNKIHNVEESRKYWEIVIGEWSFLFVQILFDRWSTVKKITSKSNDFIVAPLQGNLNKSPIDTKEFFASATLSSEWNSNLYREIIDIITSPSHSEVVARDIDSLSNIQLSQPNGIKIKAKIILNWISTFKSNTGHGILLQNVYLNKLALVRLAVKLREFPYFESFSVYPKATKKLSITPINLNISEKFTQIVDAEFINLICKIAPKYLPQVYFEIFTEHKIAALKKYHSRIPRIAVTANSFSLNEDWKKWIAFASSNGTKIVLLQHGGLYGANSFSLIQDYELMICDKFLSWGWKSETNTKVISGVPTKLLGEKRTKSLSKRDGIKLVAFEMPLHSYWLASMPIGPQVIDAALSSLDFIGYLDSEVLEKIEVLPYPTNYGLNAKDRYLKVLSHSQVLTQKISFLKSISKTRLVVSNYNGTTFIQSLSLGIPTIIFWDKELWEIDNKFQEIYDELFENNILFYSSQDCAMFVNMNYRSIEVWWLSDPVQTAVKNFLKTFGNVSEKPLKKMTQLLKNT